MATRRSRLQIKPNIGPKPGRVAPSGPASKPDTRRSQDVKKPEPPIPSRLIIDEKKEVVTPTELSSPAEKQQESKSELVTAVSDKIDSSQSPESAVSVGSEKKETNLSTDTAVDKNTDVKNDKKSDARPKFRSRFPKAKPNLGKIGRPDNRKVAQIKSPVKVKPDEEPDHIEVTTPTVLSIPPEPTICQQERVEKDLQCNKAYESPRASEVTEKTYSSDQNTVDEKRDLSSEEEDADLVDKPAERTEKSIFDKPVTPILKQEKKLVKKQSVGKKKKELPSIDEPPNRSTMKMMDLVYWNPSSNPMKRKAMVLKQKEDQTVNLTAPTEEENQVDTPGDNIGEDSNPLPVPQVKIGPDGNIIVNESSLVVDNKTGDEPMEAEVIEEDESTVNYRSFREKRSKTTWTDLETEKFYKALSTVGTDFSLMLNLFPGRSRREIKNKFKKEERLHRGKVDKAIKNREDFDMTDFEKFEKEAEEEHRLKEEQAAAKKAEKAEKKGRKRKSRGDNVKENKAVRTKKKRKSKKIISSTDDDTDEEEHDAESFRCESPVRASSVKEVIENLVQRRRGRPQPDSESRASDNDVSDAESEAPSVTSEMSVFVPRNARENFKKYVKKCNVEEDKTVDNQVVPSDIVPRGDVSDLMKNVLSDPWPCQNSTKPGPNAVTVKSEAVSKSVNNTLVTAASGSTPTVSAVTVTSDRTTGGPTELQHMEIPEGLIPIINTAGGADKVQIVLVHDVDADSGQTVVHVYILPKTAEELSIGGNTVQLTPTKSTLQQNTSQCSTSKQSESKHSLQSRLSDFEVKFSEHSGASAIPPSPVTPFQRPSSKSVTLAQPAAAESTVKSLLQTSSSTLSTSSLLTPGPSQTWSEGGAEISRTPVTSPSPSHSSRVCLFKEEAIPPVDPVDLTVKKEG